MRLPQSRLPGTGAPAWGRAEGPRGTRWSLRPHGAHSQMEETDSPIRGLCCAVVGEEEGAGGLGRGS